MADDRFGIVGKVVARTYEVREVVAEGGFGVVYRAYHQGFRAEVALKCLKIPSELTEEQRRSFLEQFRSEAEVLFRLSGHNSHIVRPLHVDAFHTKDQRLVPFMALEWLEGRTLDALIIERAERGRPPIELKKLIQLLTPVAGALEQAHNLPGKDGLQVVVHRDMKPENLFIAKVGGQHVAKVLDFGISKVKSTAGQMAGRASVQADALVAFSPAYGAPEQWAPRRYGQTGRWTDVWGLALTVVEAAKGDEVVTGDHQAMMGTILDTNRRPTPRNEGVEVSDTVERIFEKALAVDPRDRYQSVGSFWDDLTVALGMQREVGGPISVVLQQKGSRVTTGFDSIRPAAGPGATDVPPMPAPSAGQVSWKAGDSGKLRASAPTEMGTPGPIGGSIVRGASGGSPNANLPAPRAQLGSYADFSERSPSLGVAQGPSSGMSGTRVGGAYSSGRTRPLSSYAPSQRSLWKGLGPALALMALSIAFTILDRAYLHARGVPLSFGPVQASWVGAALMIVALVKGIGAVKRNWED